MTGKSHGEPGPVLSLVKVTLDVGPTAVARYAALTGDFNPIHIDPGFAQGTPFGGPIIHGTLGLSLLVQAIHLTFGDCRYTLDIRFAQPAPVGGRLVTGGGPDCEDPAVFRVYVKTEGGPRVIEGMLHLRGSQDNSNLQQCEDDNA